MMEELPFPCFFTLKDFQSLNPCDFVLDSPEVKMRLDGCPSGSSPLESYSLVKAFLLQHAVPTRYNVYRTSVEKLLLWCLLVVKKPIKELDERDVRRFMDFCLRPPTGWIAPRPEKRLKQTSIHRNFKKFVINPQWRPFRTTGRQADGAQNAPKIILASSTLAAEISVVNSFYLFLCFEYALGINPAAALHDAKLFTAPGAIHNGSKNFSWPEWNFFVSVAEDMAAIDPMFERKLMLIMSVYHLYLQPSEVERFGKELLISSLLDRGDGTYGLSVKSFPEMERIIICDEFVTRWVTRFRNSLGTHNTHLSLDRTPLISTQSRRAGVSRRHASLIFRMVCDEAISRLEIGGIDVPHDSPFRIATLLWLRETSLVQSAQLIPFETLHPSLRRTTKDTAYARYFAWQYERLAKLRAI